MMLMQKELLTKLMKNRRQRDAELDQIPISISIQEMAPTIFEFDKKKTYVKNSGQKKTATLEFMQTIVEIVGKQK